jgi:hypothetical protein
MKTGWLVPPLLAFAVSACDVRAPIGSSVDLRVAAIAPANGAGYGRAGAYLPLRWRGGIGATRFHVQVDDSCTAFAACAFPSPEIDDPNVTAASFVPAVELPFRTSAPVGTRYSWRVRACAGETCGDWSQPRAIIVGRSAGALNTDLNGDGYADLVISAPDSSAVVELGGRLFVYLGGPAPSATPALVISSDRIYDGLGWTVAMVGDVNGDGFGDFVAKTIGNESQLDVVPAPRVLLFLGGPTLRTEPDATFTAGIVNDENMAAAGLGDINGDGYDDFAFGGAAISPGRTAAEPGWVQVHLGGPTFVDAPDLTLLGSTQAFFGASMAGAGDVNGDGYPDIVVGGHQEPGNQASVYFGGPAMDDVADVTLNAPPQAPHLFGFSVAIAGDVNGDGFDDVVVGAPGGDGSPAAPGSAFIYFGGGSFDATPDVTITSAVEAEWFAKIVAPAGDVNGDGLADIAVVTRGVQTDVPSGVPGRAASGRRVDVFFGGATFDTVADVTFAAGTSDGYARGFAATDLDGDTLPDFVVGRWVTNYAGMGEVAIHRGSNGYSTPSLVLSGSAARDAFGAKIGR